MARIDVAEPGKSLTRIEGLAGLRLADVAYRVRRAALTGAAVAALVAGLAASVAAIQGDADAGVEPGNPGELVISVTRAGFGWRDGIRPGQLVVALGESVDGSGWFIETSDATGPYQSAEAGWDATLRTSLPLGVLGLVAGGLAILFLRTRRRWVGAVASVAVLAASIPLQVQGDPFASTIAMGAAAFIPSASLGARLGRRLGLVAIGLLAAVTVAWAGLRLSGGVAVDDEQARTIAFWATIALVVVRGVAAVMNGQSVGILRPRVVDLAVIGTLVVAAIGALTFLRVPPVAIVVVVALALAVVPALRGRVGRPIEAVLFADVREQAAAEATERERARLARELHDVPLQELVAVIRRLEILPGAEAESEDLRALAGHLRNVATELRPPVLDDLGLPAALDFLAEETSTAAIPVAARVRDETGFGEARRPPTDVELAMYRIAAEAVGNAIRHSDGTAIAIDAHVAPGRVELVISDDGTGLSSREARDAARRKRLGLASMRRRAEAIDAELSIDGSSNGTRVRVVWQA